MKKEAEKAVVGLEVDEKRIDETQTLLGMAEAMCRSLYESKSEAGYDDDLLLGLQHIIDRAMEDIESLMKFYNEAKHIEKKAA